MLNVVTPMMETVVHSTATSTLVSAHKALVARIVLQVQVSTRG